MKKIFNIENMNLVFKVIYLLHLYFCFTIYGAGNQVTLIPVLLLGCLLIVYRLFKVKVYIHYKNVKLLLLFLISYGISSLLFYKYGIMGNVKCLIWTSMQFLLLYTFDITQEKKSVEREFKIVIGTMLILILIGSIFSLTLLFMDHSSFYKALDGVIYLKGISMWGRLFGIFTDPNYASVLSVAGILFSIYFFKTTSKKWLKAFHIMNIVIQVLMITFAGSRTALVSMIVGVSCYLILSWMKTISLKSILQSILITMASVLVIYGGMQGILKGYNFLHSAFKTQLIPSLSEHGGISSENDPEEQKEEENVITLGRKDSAGDISNRRFDIWKSGFEIWQRNWLVGISDKNFIAYCVQNMPDTYIVGNGFNQFNAFHNVVIDIFVSQGVVGAIIVLCFGVSQIAEIVNYKKSKTHKKEEEGIIHILLSVCISIAVSALFLSHVFYVNCPTTYLFWLTLGYLHFFILKATENSKKEEQ